MDDLLERIKFLERIVDVITTRVDLHSDWLKIITEDLTNMREGL